MWKPTVLLLLVCLGAAACSATGSGAAFDNSGYRNTGYGYRVNALGPAGGLLPEDWKLDNYQFANGVPTDLKRSSWSGLVLLDQNDRVVRNARHPNPDLLYENLRHDGRIWVQTIPVSQDLEIKELAVLLRKFVESLSGTEETSVRVFSGVAESQAKEYSSKVLAEADATVSGYPARAAVIDIANVAELKLSQDARVQRL